MKIKVIKSVKGKAMCQQKTNYHGGRKDNYFTVTLNDTKAKYITHHHRVIMDVYNRHRVAVSNYVAMSRGVVANLRRQSLHTGALVLSIAMPSRTCLHEPCFAFLRVKGLKLCLKMINLCNTEK